LAVEASASPSKPENEVKGSGSSDGHRTDDSTVAVEKGGEDEDDAGGGDGKKHKKKRKHRYVGLCLFSRA